MKYTLVSTAAIVTMILTTGVPQLRAQPKPIQLWPAGHPANDGDHPPQAGPDDRGITTVTSKPGILPYLPERSAASRAAVVICPGGGYARLAMEHEGTQVAEWFQARGIAAFVLKYRCGGGDNRYPVPQQDAFRALRLVRSRASEWNVDPDKIGVMGFSAGGHLASSVATLAPEGDDSADDSIDRQSARANFAVLVYPVISMLPEDGHSGSRHNLIGRDAGDELSRRMSTQLQVTKQTPPTFLLHAADDEAVPLKGVLEFAAALDEHSLPLELHVVPRGGHGFGMRKNEGRYLRDWPSLLEAWLIDRQLLTGDERP